MEKDQTGSNLFRPLQSLRVSSEKLRDRTLAAFGTRDRTRIQKRDARRARRAAISSAVLASHGSGGTPGPGTHLDHDRFQPQQMSLPVLSIDASVSNDFSQTPYGTGRIWCCRDTDLQPYGPAA